MPAHNGSTYISQALKSLLNQDQTDFRLVIVDDCSTDDTAEIIRKFADQDSRIHVVQSEERLGLIQAWRLSYEVARQLYAPRFFAWVSDHDILAPSWLSLHMAGLEKYRTAGMVYSVPSYVGPGGRASRRTPPKAFVTYGKKDVHALHDVCTRQEGAGNAVYGLYRTKWLEQAGVFRSVTYPDRLLMVELANYVGVKNIEDGLWKRRVFGPGKQDYEQEVKQQAGKLFGPEGPLYMPLHRFCPTWSALCGICPLPPSSRIFPGRFGDV